MAVSKDSLVFDVQVNAKDSTKEVDDLSKSTSALNAVILKLTEIQKLNAQLLIVQAQGLSSYDSIQKTQIESTSKYIKSNEGLHDSLASVYYSVELADKATASWSDTSKAFLGLGVASGVGYLALQFTSLLKSMIPASKGASSFFSTMNIGTGRILHSLEAVNLLSPALFAFSSMAEKSESSFVRLMGSIAKFAAIISLGLMGALIFVTGAIGSAFEAMGDKIMGSLSESEEKFANFESTMSKFTFTLAGFSRVYGESVIGSLDKWNGVIDGIYKSTTFTREEIIKATKLFVSEGTALGLTADQNEKLLLRTADIAAASGEKIDEVSQKIVSGLTNNAQAVLSLGIDLRESSLAHTEYAKSVGISSDQMTDQQKALIRMNALFEKTTPVIGAAAASLDTVKGSSEKYEKTIEGMKIKLGEAGVATRAFLVLQNKFADWLAQTPDSVVSFAGTVLDLSGVILKVTGVLLKYGVVLYSSIFIMKLAAAAVSTLTGSAVSLASVLSFLAAKVVPVVAVLFAISQAISELSKESAAFAETMNEIAQSFSFSKKEVEKTTESVSLLTNAIKIFVEPVKLAISGLAQLINYLAKLSIMIRSVFTDNEDDLDAMGMMIEVLDDRINSLSKSSEKSIAFLNVFGDSTAYASESIQQLNSETVKTISWLDDFKNRVIKSAAEINSAYDKTIERTQVLGTEFEKAIATAKTASAELDKVFKSKLSERESAQKYADAERALNKANLDIEKMRLDTIKKINEENQNLEIQLLRSNGQNIAAIKSETATRLQELEKQIEGLKTLGNLRDEDLTAINKTKNLIEKLSMANINQEQEKHLEKINDLKKTIAQINAEIYGADKNEIVSTKLKTEAKLQELKKTEQQLRASNDLSKTAKSLLSVERESLALAEKTNIQNVMKDAYDEILKKTDEIKAQALDLNATQQEKLKHELEGQLKLIDLEKERLKIRGLLPSFGPPTAEQSKLIEGLEAQKKALTDINAIKSKAAPSQQYEAAKMAGDDMAKSITGAFHGGAMGMMDGFGSVLDAVQGLIDYIPNMLSKIEKVLTSLTDLPGKIMAGVQGVFSAALKFVSDFIPNVAANAEKIINAATEFLIKLPDTFAVLLDRIPDIILGLVDRLPEIIKRFTIAFEKAAPKMVTSLVKALIKNGPHIAKNISWLLAVELPRAIAEGLWQALKEVFSGKFNLADMFDTASISDTFKKIGTALTGEASRLFSVTDFGAGTESIQQTALQTANAINKAFNDGVNLLMKAWKWLLDMVINPLINGLRAVWLWIYDTIIQPIFNGLKAVWSWVYDTIISPFINALSSAWNAVKSGIIDPLINGLSNAANGLRDALKPLINAGQNIVNGIKDGLNSIISKISDAFYNIGKNLVKGLIDSLGSIGGVIGKAIGGLPSISVPAPSFFAHGGIVGGAANVVGNSYRNDTIPAMLSPGEAVIPRSAMRDPAIAEAVKAILSGGGISRFANGMMPSLSPAASQSSIELGGITINTTQSIDADFVRLKLMPTIQKELRRASLDGQTVIYKTGVR